MSPRERCGGCLSWSDAYDGECDCPQEGWEGVTKDYKGGSSAVSSCASAPLRGAAVRAL